MAASSSRFFFHDKFTYDMICTRGAHCALPLGAWVSLFASAKFLGFGWPYTRYISPFPAKRVWKMFVLIVQ